MYNALGRMASQHVSVFLSLDLDEASVSVLSLDVNGKTHPIASELYPTASKNSLPAVAPLTLSFNAENIPAVSFARFVIQGTILVFCIMNFSFSFLIDTSSLLL